LCALLNGRLSYIRLGDKCKIGALLSV